jgi:hypothetical protein
MDAYLSFLLDAAIRTVTQIWHLVPQTQSQPQPHLPQLVNSILTPPQAYDQPSNLPNLPQANHQNLTPPVQYPLTPESLSPGTPPGSQSSPAEDDSTTGASQHPSESEFYPHPPPLHIPHLHEHLPPQPHSHDGNHPSGCVDRSSMRFFVHELVRRSRISSTVLEVALCYIVGAKPKIQEARLGGQIWDEEVWARINNATEATRPPTPPASQSPVDQGPLNSFIPQDPFPCPLLDPKRTFLAALVLAAKFTHDRGYSNKAWARASGLPGKEVSRCERTLGEALNWRLWVGKQRESEREKDPAVDVLRTEQDPLAMHLIRQAVGAEWSRRLGARPVPICVGGPLMIRQPARRLPTDNPDFLNGSYLVPRPFPIARHPSSVPAFAQPPQATYGTCTTSSSIGITSHETMPCEVDPPSWTLEDLLNLDAANDVKPLSEYTRASTSTVTAPAAGYPDIERAKPVLNKCSLTNGLLGGALSLFIYSLVLDVHPDISEQSNRGDATMSVPEATQLGFLDADGLGGYLSSTAPMDLSTPALAKAFDHNTFDQASSSLMPDMEMLFQSLNGFIEPQSTSAIHPDSLRWSYGMCLATSSSSNAYSWEPAAQIVTSA